MLDTKAILAQMAELQRIQEEAAKAMQALANQRQSMVDAIHDQIRAHLTEANALIDQLNQMGSKYDHVALGKDNALTHAKGKGTTRSQGHCDVCKIDGHDARSHRHLADPKKPFTQEELVARNFPGYPNSGLPDAPETPAPETPATDTTAEQPSWTVVTA